METEEKRLKIEKIERYDKELNAKSKEAFTNGLLSLIGVVAGFSLIRAVNMNYGNPIFYAILGTLSLVSGTIGGIKTIGNSIDLKILRVLKAEAKAELGEEEVQPTLKKVRR